MRKVVVVTSVSGSGGTTVGRGVARRLGTLFYELDVRHYPHRRRIYTTSCDCARRPKSTAS